MRWPAADLLRVLGDRSAEDLAAALGASRRTVHRYRRDGAGLSTFRADELACRAGFHPIEVWPDW